MKPSVIILRIALLSLFSVLLACCSQRSLAIVPLQHAETDHGRINTTDHALGTVLVWDRTLNPGSQIASKFDLSKETYKYPVSTTSVRTSDNSASVKGREVELQGPIFKEIANASAKIGKMVNIDLSNFKRERYNGATYKEGYLLNHHTTRPWRDGLSATDDKDKIFACVTEVGKASHVRIVYSGLPDAAEPKKSTAASGAAAVPKSEGAGTPPDNKGKKTTATGANAKTSPAKAGANKRAENASDTPADNAPEAPNTAPKKSAASQDEGVDLTKSSTFNASVSLPGIDGKTKVVSVRIFGGDSINWAGTDLNAFVIYQFYKVTTDHETDRLRFVPANLKESEIRDFVTELRRGSM